MPIRMSIIIRTRNNKCWREPLSTVGGAASWCSHCEKVWRSFQIAKMTMPMLSGIITPTCGKAMKKNLEEVSV